MGKGVNYGGGFNRKDTPLAQLPEKPLALNAKFFREIVRRIETIVPTEASPAVIKVRKPKDGASPGLEIVFDAKEVILDVCLNGQPSTLTVYAKEEEGQ